MKEQVGITEKITFTLNGVPIEPGKVPVEAKPAEPVPDQVKDNDK